MDEKKQRRLGYYLDFEVIQLADSRYGRLHPTEDSYLTAPNVFVVADGVTRDPLGLSDFTGCSQVEVLATYPKPSPALLAAETFCKVFVRRAVNDEGENLKAAALEANFAIEYINRGRNVDYLVNDFAACVATGGVVVDHVLKWVTCGDCQISVFSQSGKSIFTTPNGVGAWASHAKKVNFDWNTPEGRRLVRSQYRNRPDQIVDLKCVSYGAFTGEPSVEPFIDTGQLKLEKGDSIACYSDGFGPTVEHKDFLSMVKSSRVDFENWSNHLANQNYAKYGHERTLVIAQT
jgi:serine/threonine protein phosphatase PrpC